MSHLVHPFITLKAKFQLIFPQIKHIRGILFEEENVRKPTTATKQSEVKKKTLQKKRSDKPVVEQNSDIGQVPVIDEPRQTKSATDDSESNAVVIISDEDTTDVEKSNNEASVKKSSSISNPIPSTSKNLLESGKSFMGSSKTLIKPSQTVVRAEATSSGIKSKKESSLDKAYLCGRCCNYSGHTIANVRAHQAAAHPNVECEVLMRNTSESETQNKGTPKHLPDETVNRTKSKLSDSINYVCNTCIFKSENPLTIYRHWKENHKFAKVTTNNIEFPSRPFMFRVIKSFKCCYCRKSSHYKDLKVHSIRNHPMEEFAVINMLDPKKCALCSHEFNTAVDNQREIIDHFKTSHKNETSEPDTYLTDELMDEITSILPREQVKCTQPNCNTIFFSMDELNEHTNVKHATLEKQFVSVPSDPIMYGCAICSETMVNESDMVAHIRQHILHYQCKFCEKRYNLLEMVKVHHEIMHASKDETYRNIDVTENLHTYSGMKIIFPNGFVLTKADAKHTKYGVMDDIVKLVNDLNIADLEVVRKRQEEQNTKAEKDVKSVIVKKKNLKRSRIVDSDSDDIPPKEPPTLRRKIKPSAKPETKVPSKSSSPLKSKVDSSGASDDNIPLNDLVPRSPSLRTSQRRLTVMKKAVLQSKPTGSKLNISTTSTPPPPPPAIPTSKLISKAIATTSHNRKPLQGLIPFTNYGKKTKPVDLSKLYIDMPFGTGSVKVSCDRFALLFNINPKLRLKRCDNLMKGK